MINDQRSTVNDHDQRATINGQRKAMQRLARGPMPNCFFVER